MWASVLDPCFPSKCCQNSNFSLLLHKRKKLTFCWEKNLLLVAVNLSSLIFSPFSSQKKVCIHFNILAIVLENEYFFKISFLLLFYFLNCLFFLSFFGGLFIFLSEPCSMQIKNTFSAISSATPAENDVVLNSEKLGYLCE